MFCTQRICGPRRCSDEQKETYHFTVGTDNNPITGYGCGGSGNNGGNKKNNRNLRSVLSLIGWALVLTLVFNYILAMTSGGKSFEITYSQMMNLVQEDQIKKIELKDGVLYATPVDGYTYTQESSNKNQQPRTYTQSEKNPITLYTTYLTDTRLLPLLDEHGVEYSSPVKSSWSVLGDILVMYILPMLLTMGLIVLVMRIVSKNGGSIGGIGNVGKSNAKVYMEKQTGVTFKDVAGQDEAKESLQEIIDILNLADQLKYETKHGIEHHHLKGKCLAMIFEKSSTRTRVSFEVGINQLGGYAVVLAGEGSQIGRGEPVQDTARVLSRYVDGIMIRTYEQKEVEDLANYGSIPIINGLTDFCHPCQVLADLMTIREKFAVLEGLKLCYIGDGNNMANSLIVGGLKTGMKVSIATPVDYRPDAEVMAFAEPNPNFFITDDPMKAAENADVVITDTWASMGQEAEKEVRMKAFQGYQVNDELLAAAKPGCMVQHCLPAYREQEITTKVFEEHANEIFEEAENRLHAQKAVMVTLMGSKED